jgi:hypothetical protein
MKFIKIQHKNYPKGLIGLLLLTQLAIPFSSCKKLIEIPAPATSITSQNIYSADATAISVLTGVFASLSNNDLQVSGISGMYLSAGLSADEVTLYDLGSSAYAPYYYNHLLVSTTAMTDSWSPSYTQLLTINSAIEGLMASKSLTLSTQKQLLGEAYFMRALYYFYLVNLYGDVPLVLTSDYTINASLGRSAQDKVYQQIISDLTAADGLLSANYLNATLTATVTQRIRPTKWAAEALLSRAYLYCGNLTGDAANYNKAVTQGLNVIGNSLYSLPSLTDVFSANSSETIWSLQPVGSSSTGNTGEGLFFILPATGPGVSLNGYPVYLSDQVVNAFETGDQRLTNWVGSVTTGGHTYNYAYKYKQGNGSTTTQENIIVLRLAEQYLIVAEAYANTGDLANAAKYLNIVRSRCGLTNVTVSTQANMLTAIWHERQVELFTEWGHRWLDLKRTKRVDAVMTAVCPTKGTTWDTRWQWYPIPANDLQSDLNLVQNPGY